MRLNSDQPKTTKEQDALDFTDSAESVAKIILDDKYPDGFVIGIEGEWGSGKTTYINLIRKSLKKQSPKFQIIEFKPWLHSSQENLIAAYFKLLSKEANDIFGDNSIKENLANVVDSFTPLVGTLASLAGLGDTTKSAMGLVSKKLKESPTLESQYEIIQKKLTEAKKPFVVIIDDLDRLDSDEIKTMLKLVKSVGRLPYVTYILAYDRKYVESATNKEMPHFLEKIIQLPIPIPKPDKNKLLKMLRDGLKDFLQNINENNNRWHTIGINGMHTYINTPREVALLTNAINFRFQAANEIIDLVDFFALEALRLFKPKIWNWIKDSEDAVFLIGDFGFLHEDSDFRKALEKSFPIKLEDLSRNQKSTLSLLFPNLAKVLDNSEYGSTEAIHDAYNRCGVRIPLFYDAYFSQYLDKAVISKADMNRFLENTADKEKLTKELIHWIDEDNNYKNSRITEFLRNVYYHFMDNNNPNPDPTLLWVLSDAFKYTKPLQELSPPHRTSPYGYLETTFRVLFEKIGTQETSTFLQALCKDKKHLDAAVYLLFYVGYYIGKTYSGSKSSKEIDLIDDKDWDKILKIIAPHLKDAFLTGEVGNFAHVISANLLAPLIFDTKQVHSMIKKACVESELYIIKFIKGHLGYTTSTDGNRRTFRESRYPELFDFGIIAELAEKIDLKQHDDDTKEAIKLFIKGVRTPELLTDDEKSRL